MESVVTRKNRKELRDERITKRYEQILRRLGGVAQLTPNYEILEEIANEFAIEPTTASRIIARNMRKKRNGAV